MDRSFTLERLVWDDWNRDHIARHGVTLEEAEEVVNRAVVVRGTYKNRFQVIGPTRAGRMLAIVIGPVPGQPGAYYTFSARPDSRRERRHYRDQTEGRAS